MTMKRLLILRGALAIMLASFSACEKSNDAERYYSKDKEMQILDQEGNAVNSVYASIYSGQLVSIVGGTGNNHIVEVADESVLGIIYCSKGKDHQFYPDLNMPAQVYLIPKKYGSTIVSITDADDDRTIHLEVEVANHYATLKIKESSVDGLEPGMLLVFAMDDTNEYRIVSQSGKEYDSHEKGEYHWGEYDPEENSIQLTFYLDDKETTWKITDADNNSSGSEFYDGNVWDGLALPGEEVMTKEPPATVWSSLFLFTDTNNPERTFKTGSRNTSPDLVYKFE